MRLERLAEVERLGRGRFRRVVLLAVKVENIEGFLRSPRSERRGDCGGGIEGNRPVGVRHNGSVSRRGELLECHRLECHGLECNRLERERFHWSSCGSDWSSGGGGGGRRRSFILGKSIVHEDRTFSGGCLDASRLHRLQSGVDCGRGAIVGIKSVDELDLRGGWRYLKWKID